MIGRRVVLLFVFCSLFLACSGEGDKPVDRGSTGAVNTDEPEVTGDDGTDPGFGDQPTGSAPPNPGGGDLAPVGEREDIIVDECPGTLDAGLVAALQDPNVQASGTRWLYPYENTVFPRGLEAPVLQWDNVAGADSIYVHLKSMLLDYKICLPLSESMRFQLPANVWVTAAEQARGSGDPLTIDVTLGAGGAATRLATLTISFALANIKGRHLLQHLRLFDGQ